MEKILNVYLEDEIATEAFGRKIADSIKTHRDTILGNGLNLRLDGDLGAGKTYLIRSCLRALGFEGRVKSPTFTLLETYTIDGLRWNHFDFYRFETPEEFDDAGFREAFGPGQVTACEWSEKAYPYVPDADILIRYTIADEGRDLELTAMSTLGEDILKDLK